MRLEDNTYSEKELMKRIGIIDTKGAPKKRSVVLWYFVIAMVVAFFAVFSLELFLLLLLMLSLIYLPFLFATRYSPKTTVDMEERIVVDEDISHFKERVEKALKGNAVAQRDIELRVLNALAIDLSIRYDISENMVRLNLDNEKFLERYLGEKAKVVANIFRRRHDLRTVLPKNEFLKEINTVLEAMK